MELIVAVLILGVVFGILGRYVAIQKGRTELEGIILGALFGPLGCLIVAVLPAVARATTSPHPPAVDRAAMTVDLATVHPVERRVAERAIRILDEAGIRDQQRRERREQARRSLGRG